MSWSNHYQQMILDAAHDQATPSWPATVHVALSSTAPAADGTNVTEPSSNGYARLALTQATDLSRTSQEVSNGSDQSFPESSGAWLGGASLTHFAVYDASTGGNLLWYGQLTTARTVDAAGITLTIPAGELTSRAEPTP